MPPLTPEEREQFRDLMEGIESLPPIRPMSVRVLPGMAAVWTKDHTQRFRRTLNGWTFEGERRVRCLIPDEELELDLNDPSTRVLIAHARTKDGDAR